MKICSSCKQEKDRGEYYFRNKENGILETYCKPCSIRIKCDRRRRRTAENPEKYRQIGRDWGAKRSDPAYRAMFFCQDANKNDKKKGRDNDLTKEFAELLLRECCRYCGDDQNRMTLDRVDNDLGHLQSNVVPSCVRCNITRGQMPYEAWLVVAQGMRTAREAGLFGGWDGDLRRRKS